MHIHTIEDDFEYQMKKIFSSICDEYPELKELNAEQLQNKLWEDKFAIVLGRSVLETCINYSGDELF